MATGTVPAAVPGPPEQPHQAPTAGEQPKSLLASMVAAVEPARPTFDLAPTGAGSTTTAADGALDRSAPGVSSASFRSTAEQAAKDGDPAGTRHKRSIWKEMWLAAATRWAKGGGAANKRLDLAKARAQAHQVKENRTTTVTKSGGLPVRNSGGSGAGSDKGSGKGGGNSPKTAPPIPSDPVRTVPAAPGPAAVEAAAGPADRATTDPARPGGAAMPLGRTRTPARTQRARRGWRARTTPQPTPPASSIPQPRKPRWRSPARPATQTAPKPAESSTTSRRTATAPATAGATRRPRTPRNTTASTRRTPLTSRRTTAPRAPSSPRRGTTE